MKYTLIIDKNAEEEITAIVHAPSSLTQQIEDMIRNHSGADQLSRFFTRRTNQHLNHSIQSW